MLVVYLHSEDTKDPAAVERRHPNDDVRHVVVSHGVKADEIFSLAFKVLKREEQSKPFGLIDLLVINSQVSPGVIHLGGSADESFDITSGNAASFATPFQRFLKFNAIGGRGVEILGRGVALGRTGGMKTDAIGKGDDPNFGYRLLFQLACGFDHRVVASATGDFTNDDSSVGESAEGEVPDPIVVTPDSDPDAWEGNVLTLPLSPNAHRKRVEELMGSVEGVPLLRNGRRTRPGTVSDVRYAPW